MEPIRRILVVLALDPPDLSVIEYALPIVEGLGAMAEVLHVCEAGPRSSQESDPGVIGGAAARLIRLREQLAPEARNRLGYRIELGEPSERILARAKEGVFDLIAIGSERRLRGIVDTVIRRAPCAVLIVPEHVGAESDATVGTVSRYTAGSTPG